MTARSRSRLSSQHPSALLHPHDDPFVDHAQQPFSASSSATTSRQASNASIFSLPFHSQSRNSTPPTPIHSPSLYKPPSQMPANGDGLADGHHLHPAQYQKSVKETHQLQIGTDPITNRKSINHYQIIDEIGRGTHGKVKLGLDTKTQEMVAIKIVERSQGRPRLGRKGDGENAETKTRREIAILKKTRHENVVKLLEVIDDTRSKKVYLILEYIVRGEVKWRKKVDPDVLVRDRERIRKQIQSANSCPPSVSKGCSGKGRIRLSRRKKKVPSHIWSLEFEPESDAEESSPRNISKVLEDGNADTDSQAGADVSESDESEADEESWGPALDIEEARRCFRDTVVGLDYLHWNGIIHRDIKPANLLWTHDNVTKISDFGVSFLGRPFRDDDDEGTGGEDEITGFEQDELELAKTAGTPAFFAPELCIVGTDPNKPKPPITNAIDVWALGVTLFCFIFGRLPFTASHEYVLFNRIAEDEVVIPRRRIRPQKPQLDPHTCHNMTPEELEEYETEPVDDILCDIIRRLLTKDPARRITLKEVKHHPWVLQGIEEPDKWIDATDPEKSSRGTRIEVTNEDVEAAVSSTGVFGRAKNVMNVMKKAGSWYRGFRKRASSTPNVSEDDSKEDKGRDAKASKPRNGMLRQAVDGDGTRKYVAKDDSDRELQWMGGMREDMKEADRLDSLAPSKTNSSAGSSETVHGYSSDYNSSGAGDIPFPSKQRFPTPPFYHPPSLQDKKTLRRKQSVGSLRGGPALFRHASACHDLPRAIRESHLRPTHAPPSTPACGCPSSFKAESTAALASPSVLQRMVRSARSHDFVYDSRHGGSLAAREVLKEALHPENYSNAHDYPRPPSSQRCAHLLVDEINEFPLRPCSTDSESSVGQEKTRKHGYGTPEAALRRRYSHIPDDDCSLEHTPRQANQQPINKIQETHQLPPAELPTSSPAEWSRYWRPTNGWAVSPPIPIASRPGGYFESPNQSPGHRTSNQSSLNNNTTAYSSMTNSMSFPSETTQPSSLSSDCIYQLCRLQSPVSDKPDVAFEEHVRAQSAQPISRPQSRRNSEFIFAPDSDDEACDDDSDSEGGFVMMPRKSRKSIVRPQSVAVGVLARQPHEEKAEIMRSSERRQLRNRSKSSGGSTIKRKDCTRGRRLSRPADDEEP